MGSLKDIHKKLHFLCKMDTYDMQEEEGKSKR